MKQSNVYFNFMILLLMMLTEELHDRKKNLNILLHNMMN